MNNSKWSYFIFTIILILLCSPSYATTETNKTIAELVLEGKRVINVMQDDMEKMLGPNGSKISVKQMRDFYCKYPENWNIDQAFIAGTAEAKFTSTYIVEGESRKFTRGYLWGGTALGPKGFNVLYEADCSGLTFGFYGLAGYCVPFYSSYDFYDHRNELFQEVALDKAEDGMVAYFSGHVAIVTNVEKHEMTWNGTTKDYTNYNGQKGRIFRWKGGAPKICNLEELASNRDKLYTYREPGFCKE